MFTDHHLKWRWRCTFTTSKLLIIIQGIFFKYTLWCLKSAIKKMLFEKRSEVAVIDKNIRGRHDCLCLCVFFWPEILSMLVSSFCENYYYYYFVNYLENIPVFKITSEFDWLTVYLIKKKDLVVWWYFLNC